jgi:hypothetical protein
VVLGGFNEFELVTSPLVEEVLFFFKKEPKTVALPGFYGFFIPSAQRSHGVWGLAPEIT